MLVVYDGKFFPIIAVVSYYIGFGVIFLFNILLTTNREDYSNPIYWIGWLDNHILIFFILKLSIF